MNFDEQLPDWLAEGTEPPTSKKTDGWQPDDKPPAGYFNWLFNRTYKAFLEIRNKISNLTGSDVTLVDTSNNFASTNVEGAMSELFTNVSNGKTAVASAITGKGVVASGSDTFTQLSTKIGQISTGTGDAVAADVLTGKTFTNGNSSGISGAMPNQGATTLTPSGTGPVTIPAGYHNGSGTVLQVTVPAANVKAGTTIAGVAGTMTDRGATTLTPSGTGPVTIPAGYHNGSGTVSQVTVPAANVKAGTTIAGVAGTMTDRGAVTITPSASSQAIPAGYHNGSGNVPAVVVPAANVLTGTTIAGTAGTMPNMVGVINAQGTAQWGDGALAVYPPKGYYKGGSGDGELKVSVAQLQAAEPDLIGASITAGVTLYGIAGTNSKSGYYASGFMSRAGFTYTRTVGNWYICDFDVPFLVNEALFFGGYDTGTGWGGYSLDDSNNKRGWWSNGMQNAKANDGIEASYLLRKVTYLQWGSAQIPTGGVYWYAWGRQL
ncbi:hypothetical protein QFZ77_005412 [Paenibacillus sp. V4I3]|uniref:hypothetical protein n=1 Tax=Paenibacillus sp. V4I3 TaxID=3042305 RepID=UPI0027840B84|nr:hypothetical protein [Paenibacillus sp. V4I3]MDQ0876753.1 hypothetical protein [Paenibacillus sp. V4I3]